VKKLVSLLAVVTIFVGPMAKASNCDVLLAQIMEQFEKVGQMEGMRMSLEMLQAKTGTNLSVQINSIQLQIDASKPNVLANATMFQNLCMK
jgi:hypothetical protein